MIPPVTESSTNADSSHILAPAEERARETISHAAERAERRAWVILWTAFATFCVLAAAGYRLVTDYVTTADIQLTARADQKQGDVTVRRPGAADALWTPADRELPVGTRLSARRASSLQVRFFEDSHMTMLSGSEVELASMNVGRFISSRTALRLKQVDGPVRYQTEGEVQVLVPNGLVRVGPGDATVWVQGQETRVLVYAGSARLEASGVSTVVPTGNRARLTAQRQVEQPTPRATDLLANGDFAKAQEGWETDDQPPASKEPRDVNGERRLVTANVEGAQVPALRIVRNSVKNQHGETGLRQRLGVDVSGYRSLYVDAWVRVDGANLPGGGQLGSEYPMILRLEYEGPQEFNQPDWHVGFYAQDPDGWPLPEKIAQKVPLGQWFHYRSANLMDQEMSRRPFVLLGFEVMGQGHSYDAQVANVRLIGD